MNPSADPFTLFADEATESLRTAEACLLALEDGSLDELNALYRAMHSLKGNARVMGFEATEEVAHAAEDAVSLLRDHGLEPDARLFELLFRSLDVIGEGCARSAEARADVAPAGAEALRQDLRRYVDEHAPHPSSPPEPALPSQAPGDLFLFEGDEVVSIVDVMEEATPSWVPQAVPTEDLVALTYCSEATRPLDLPELEALLRACRTANPARGITGQLLSTRRWFLQYLEGPRRAINDLYHRLLHDPRHRHVTLIAYEPLAARRMAGWTMSYAAMGPRLAAMLSDIAAPAADQAPLSLAPEAARELLTSWRPMALSHLPPTSA